jgi:ABC-type lipoprotein export system ATPase subunit
MNLITLKDVSLSFISGKETIKVIQNLSFAFPDSGLFSLIGESGSGKSSLLNLLAGFLSPTGGEIKYNLPLEQIGFVFQNLFLIDHLSVRENVMLPLLLKGVSREEGSKTAQSLLEEVGIGELQERQINELSGGQKARVGVARGLALGGKILLADEPTGSLDSENSKKMMELFSSLGKKMLVIIVTHNEKQAMAYSDFVYAMKDFGLVNLKKKELDKKTLKPEGDEKKSRLRMRTCILLAYSFLKKRTLKVLLSLLFSSLCLSLVGTLASFSSGGKKELVSLGKECFDYSLVSCAEKREYEIPGQEMTLIKKVRLSEKTKGELLKEDPSLLFYPSFDYVLPSFLNGESVKGKFENQLFLTPSFPDLSRLSSGRLPQTFNEAVANSAFLKENSLSLNDIFSVRNDSGIETKIGDDIYKDVISLSIDFKIVGISREKEVLSRPTVYYSYPLMADYLFSLHLSNAAKGLNREMTLKERYEDYSEEDDTLTSFKTLVKTNDPLLLKERVQANHQSVYLVSFPLEMTASFQDIVSSFSKIILIFIILALICSFLLEFTFIESLYQEKKEEMAVCLSFHLSKKDFFRLGRGQDLIVGFYLSLLSVFFLFLLKAIGNRLLFSFLLPPFLTINPFIVCLLVLSSFGFAFLSGRLPLINIWKSDLVLSLKGE